MGGIWEAKGLDSGQYFRACATFLSGRNELDGIPILCVSNDTRKVLKKPKCQIEIQKVWKGQKGLLPD